MSVRYGYESYLKNMICHGGAIHQALFLFFGEVEALLCKNIVAMDGSAFLFYCRFKSKRLELLITKIKL